MSAVGSEYLTARRTAFNFVSGSAEGRPARASRSALRTHSPTVRCSRPAKRWISDSLCRNRLPYGRGSVAHGTC
jgi:hypothetical protein